MQILLVASESYAKAAIFTLLSLSTFDFMALEPEHLDSVFIDDIDTVIYVDHSPSARRIDQLRKNSKSLLLVAPEALDFEYDLFIPLKAFDACENMVNAIDSIKCFIQPAACSIQPIVSEPPLSNLASRQIDILRLLYLGQSKKKILDQLDICPRTYQIHADKLRTVFGVTSNIALIHKVHTMGITFQSLVAV
jgi:DNA-binding CsgD family transcriptional regulator